MYEIQKFDVNISHSSNTKLVCDREIVQKHENDMFGFESIGTKEKKNNWKLEWVYGKL